MTSAPLVCYFEHYQERAAVVNRVARLRPVDGRFALRGGRFVELAGDAG